MEAKAEAVLRDMIVERQRFLIREANYLRGLVGLAPVELVPSEEGLGATAMAPSALLDLTPNRRAVVAAVALCMARGDAPTYSVLRHRSGIAKRTFARSLAWAVTATVVTRTERGYLPGPAWAACVDSDAELLGLVPRDVAPLAPAAPRDVDEGLTR